MIIIDETSALPLLRGKGLLSSLGSIQTLCIPDLYSALLGV